MQVSVFKRENQIESNLNVGASSLSFMSTVYGIEQAFSHENFLINIPMIARLWHYKRREPIILQTHPVSMDCFIDSLSNKYGIYVITHWLI